MSGNQVEITLCTVFPLPLIGTTSPRLPNPRGEQNKDAPSAASPSDMTEFLHRARRFLKDCRAQDLVEYALLAGFVTLTLTAAFPALSRPWRKLARKMATVLALAAAGGAGISC